MRFFDSQELSALSARSIVARDILWVTAKDRGSGAPVNYGFSSLVRNLSIPVLDGRTNATVSRTFVGLGAALKIEQIPLTSDLTVRQIHMELPMQNPVVEEFARQADPRSAPCQVYRLLFNPDTMVSLAAAKPRFVGYVDTAPITTPQAQGQGSLRLVAVSITRELTRESTDVRSHESQLKRSGDADDFYLHTSVVGDWELFWGRNQGATSAETPLTP